MGAGIIYVGHRFELGIEGTVPLNRAAGTNVGVLAQLTLRLDEVRPDALTRPPSFQRRHPREHGIAPPRKRSGRPREWIPA